MTLDRRAALETQKLLQRCRSLSPDSVPDGRLGPHRLSKLALTLRAAGKSAGRAAAPRSHLALLPVLFSGPGPTFCFLC